MPKSLDNALRGVARATTVAGSFVEGSVYGTAPPRHPPTFIVGLPRSGSTFFYQCLCHCFAFAYSTRLTRLMWFAPATAGWWIHRWRPPYRSDFRSRYGKGSDWAMPYDATLMWNLWFGKDRRLEAEQSTRRMREQSRGFVGRTERIFNAPFVERNLRCNQWLLSLSTIFSDAVFLISLRDPLSVALSLLRGRLECYGDFQTWHLLPPRTPSPHPLTCAEEEVVYQVWGIVEDLRADMLRIGPERFAALDYRALCEDPGGYMEATRAWLKDKGIAVALRHDPPPTFKPSVQRGDRLSTEQISTVEDAVARYFPSGTFEALPCDDILPGHD